MKITRHFDDGKRLNPFSSPAGTVEPARFDAKRHMRIQSSVPDESGTERQPGIATPDNSHCYLSGTSYGGSYGPFLD